MPNGFSRKTVTLDLISNFISTLENVSFKKCTNLRSLDVSPNIIGLTTANGVFMYLFGSLENLIEISNLPFENFRCSKFKVTKGFLVPVASFESLPTWKTRSGRAF